MATLGNITIVDSQSRYTSGVAFLLVSTNKTHETVEISSDAYVEVNSMSHYVVTRFNGATTAEEAYEAGHELAQKGLDLLSIQGKGNLSIKNASEEHLLWWRNSGIQVLRSVSTSTLTFYMPPITVTIHDAEGNEVQVPKKMPIYHEAFRYFRLSQVTDDLYDSYRNMYLAFESLLSSRYPKQRNESESTWLHRSIESIMTLIGDPSLLLQREINATDKIMEIVYHKTRLPLFHAKEGRDHYPPQSAEYRQVVQSALELLTKIVLKISEDCYNVRHPNNFVYTHWVYKNIIGILSSAKMLMSDDPSAFDPSQSDLSHGRYKNSAWFNTEVLSGDKEAEGPAIFGSHFVGKGCDNISVRRFEVVGDNEPLYVCILENELTLAGIDKLECQFKTRVSNVGQPKSRFPR